MSGSLTRLGMTLAILGAACGVTPKPTSGLQVETTPAGNDTRMTLLAAPGLKVSARLKPALELGDGRVFRFDSPRLTPDSAYFAEPPSVLVPGRHARVHGKVRASVCDPGKTVCRTLAVDL